MLGFIRPHLWYSRLVGVGSCHKGRPRWPLGVRELGQFISHGYLRPELDRIWSAKCFQTDLLLIRKVISGYIFSHPAAHNQHWLRFQYLWFDVSECMCGALNPPKATSMDPFQQNAAAAVFNCSLVMHCCLFVMISLLLLLLLLLIWKFPLGYLSVGKKLF